MRRTLYCYLHLLPYTAIMTSSKLIIPPEFIAASKEQRIDFVQDLWDQIAQDPQSVPVPAYHKHIIRKRLKVYRSSPTEGKSWSEVREQLLDDYTRA